MLAVVWLKARYGGGYGALSEKHTVGSRPRPRRRAGVCARLVHSFVPSHCGQLVPLSCVPVGAGGNAGPALKSHLKQVFIVVLRARMDAWLKTDQCLASPAGYACRRTAPRLSTMLCTESVGALLGGLSEMGIAALNAILRARSRVAVQGVDMSNPEPKT